MMNTILHSSLESEQISTSSMQTKLQQQPLLPPLIENFEGSWLPLYWTQHLYSQISAPGEWTRKTYGVDLLDPYCGNPPTGLYYAAADSYFATPPAFEVGLFTPALDLSPSSHCCPKYRLEYQYSFVNMHVANKAEVRLWSGGTLPPDDPNFNAQLEATLKKHVLPLGFWTYSQEVLEFQPQDPTKVYYIEFYYSSEGHGKFCIDDVKIAPGGIWYVDVNNGDNSYNGLYQAYLGGSDGPFETISKAVSVCTDCDTIYVAEGTYVENVAVTIPTGLSIIGVDGPSLTFVDGSGSVSHAFYLHSDCHTIEGFTIQNSLLYGINILDSDYNHIINNVIKNNQFGIVMDNAKDNIIEENDEINSNIEDGINIRNSCSNNVIRTNHIESNGGYGVFIDSLSHDNLIYNNYFDNTYNAWDVGTGNVWYILPTTQYGQNIMTGLKQGGNRWNNAPPPWGGSGIEPCYLPYPIPPNIFPILGNRDEYPIPGFELVAAIIAIAIALIILRRKK